MNKGSLLILGAFALVALTGNAPGQTPPAKLHLIDVEDGHALLLDVGEFEIMFDSGAGRGDYLGTYLRNNKIIDGDLDLLIISDGHVDAFGGADRLFFRPSPNAPAGTSPDPPAGIAEVWTYGEISEWASSCKSSQTFLTFLERVRAQDRMRVRSPVQSSIRPIMDGGSAEGIVLSREPLIKVFLLNAGISNLPKRAEEDSGECPRLTNQGAIVLGLEIHGVRILLAGDVETGYDTATGSFRKHDYLYREDQIADRISSLPWFQNVDILLAPRKGSSLANSQRFIDIVRPKYVLFGSQSRFNNPTREVVDRYAKQQATVLSTARSASAGTDDVVCSWSNTSDLKCDYGGISDQGTAEWRGRLASGKAITQEVVNEIIKKVERDRERGQKPAFAGTEVPANSELKGADLYGIDLSGKNLSRFDLSGAKLTHGNFSGATLNESDLTRANLDYANFSGANLTGAKIDNVDVRHLRAPSAKFDEAQITNTTFRDTTLSKASFRRTIMRSVGLKNVAIDHALFEPTNFSLSEPQSSLKQVEDIDDINQLHTLRFEDSPTALVKIRKYFADSGQRADAADITYAIEASKQRAAGPFEWGLRYLFFDLPTAYGRAPNRPLFIIIGAIPVFSAIYMLAVFRKSGAGLYAVRAGGDSPSAVRFDSPARIHHRDWRAFAAALYFSFLSAFHFGWREINVGTWAQRLAPNQFNVDATGWVRSVSGAQSLLSFYLIVMWALMFFGNPFGG